MARRPTMTSLRLFLQVARTLSFSETARSANLSQPALSRTIKLLEEALDVRLFDRGCAKRPPDRSGRRADANGRTSDPRFRRGVPGTRADLPTASGGGSSWARCRRSPRRLLPRVIARFRAAHPKVEIVVRENLTAALEQNLQERLLDFTISTATDGQAPRSTSPPCSPTNAFWQAGPATSTRFPIRHPGPCSPICPSSAWRRGAASECSPTPRLRRTTSPCLPSMNARSLQPSAG